MYELPKPESVGDRIAVEEGSKEEEEESLLSSTSSSQSLAFQCGPASGTVQGRLQL